MEIDNIKVEILTREESTKYLGQMVTFQQQETTEIRNRIRAAWATLYTHKQDLTRSDLKILLPPTPASLVRNGDHPHDELCLRNMDDSKECGRMIQSTQRKILRLITQTKRKYKENRKNMENSERGSWKNREK